MKAFFDSNIWLHISIESDFDVYGSFKKQSLKYLLLRPIGSRGFCGGDVEVMACLFG